MGSNDFSSRRTQSGDKCPLDHLQRNPSGDSKAITLGIEHTSAADSNDHFGGPASRLHDDVKPSSTDSGDNIALPVQDSQPPRAKISWPSAYQNRAADAVHKAYDFFGTGSVTLSSATWMHRAQVGQFPAAETSRQHRIQVREQELTRRSQEFDVKHRSHISASTSAHRRAIYSGRNEHQRVRVSCCLPNFSFLLLTFRLASITALKFEVTYNKGKIKNGGIELPP